MRQICYYCCLSPASFTINGIDKEKKTSTTTTLKLMAVMVIIELIITI